MTDKTKHSRPGQVTLCVECKLKLPEADHMLVELIPLTLWDSNDSCI